MEEILHYFPTLSEQQKEQIKLLAPLYTEWNQKINVISRKDMDAFYTRHVLHSLAIAKVIHFRKGTKVLDVGTGGGFPVVPLAIFFPEVQFTAVDSIGKKIKVVQAVAEGLGLTNLQAHHKRAEELSQTFDFIVSRAVTRMNRFLPWVEKRFRKDSFNDLSNGFLFLKGGDLEEELAEVKRTMHSFEIHDFFNDPFFETKKIIYLPA